MPALVLLLLTACGSGKITLDDTTDPADPGEASDADTGGSETGIDTGEVPSDAGDYTGSVTGTLTFTEGGGGGHDGGGGGTQTAACAGQVTFTLSSDGLLVGSATCLSDPGPPIEGELTGTVAGGSVSAVWTIALGREPLDAPLTGTLATGHAVFGADIELDRMGTFAVSMDALR